KRCSFCISKKFDECLLSPDDSLRCSNCVRLNKSYCDVRGLTADQLDQVSAQHFRLEDKLESAEDALAELAVKYERMRRTVARGITDLDKLDRVEREEAEAARQAATLLPNPTDPVTAGSAVDAVDWGAFDPSLLDLDFGGSHSQGLSSVQGPQ
ncbi:hypothetical protein M431DRAFT_514422, partial [Trichoderma harzianum CBS 226.95]